MLSDICRRQRGRISRDTRARFIVRGGRFEAPEGMARSRNVVLDRKDYETAVACYHSAEYTAAKA